MTEQGFAKIFTIKFFVITVLTSAAYFVFGWLGLYFAVPPGFATSIWPPAGIAFAVLLIFGNRYWFAVWLGSMLTNLSVSYDSATMDTLWQSFSVASCIGLGAALQAVVGSTLVRKFIGYPDTLSSARSIILYTLLAGPVACLLNASFSMLILWWFDVVVLADITRQWWMWWAGDTVGVFVFAPIVMAFFAYPRYAWRPRLYSVGIPLLCVYAIFFFVLLVLQRYEVVDASKSFKSRTSAIAYLFKRNFVDAEDTLTSLQSFYDASREVTRKEFDTFTQRALMVHPSIQALSWNPVISNDQRNDYVAQARQEGLSDFEIKQLKDGKLVDDKQRPSYISVYYISPYIGNESALGFNLGSSSKRLTALHKAAANDQYIATSRIRLVQDKAKKNQYGVILFAPLYKKNVPLQTPEQRLHSVIGYLSGVLRISKMIDSVLLSSDNEEIREMFLQHEFSVSLFDLTADKHEQRLYGHVEKEFSSTLMQQLQKKISFSYQYNFGGRQWLMVISPTDKYIRGIAFWRSWATLMFALIFMGIFHLFLFVLSGQNVVIKKTVEERTRELQQSKDALSFMAHNDELTGLPNRKSFSLYLASALQRAKQDDLVLAVCFMDLDNFKQINDSLGHDVGDLFLAEVSKKLKSLLRDTDYIARMGGDEFALCIEGLESKKDLFPILDRYSTIFSHSMIIDSSEIYGSFSIGAAVFPDAGSTAEELVKHADIAMYKAKEKGKNTYAFFNKKIEDTLTRRHAIDTQLRMAINNGEFSIVYQPIVNMTGSVVSGAEVLLRWKNDTLGEVMPEEFIEIAEFAGLIGPITDWVFEQVERDFSLIKSSTSNKGFYVSVNLSPQLLSQNHFVVAFHGAIESSCFEPGELILEITEKALVKSPKNTMQQMEKLKMLGVQFALDDFGTGYSSMQYLKNLPLSLLKIDQGFVRDIQSDANDAAIVKATIQLAHGLGIAALAEGVETEQQMQYLKQQGCDYAQGYLFAKPMSLDNLIKYLSSKS
ncbi:MAG: EAL domain-containing protein [Coxiellaceae bacterium]|nr:EAL domain-containing protein [Coxiellaceae bacterium]